jgi:hypothetical protein
VSCLLALIRRPRLTGLAVALAGGWGGGAMAGAAEAWRLPPVDGEISGEFAFRPEAGGPAMRWSVSVRTDASRQRRAQFKMEGEGMNVSGEALVDAAGDGTWRLTAGEIELGRWFALVAAQLDPEYTDMTCQGTVVASGGGSVHGGVAEGRVRLSVQDGRMEVPIRKLQLDGVSASVEIEDVGSLRSARSQVMAWQGGRFDTIPLGRGQMLFAVEGTELRVEQGTCALLGGELSVGAFVFSLAKPYFSVTARLVGLDIVALKDFFPPVLLAARGRLDGSMVLFRTATGIEIGPGRLSLRKGETAELRLAPSPGLLSSSLPAKIQKYYPGLAKIEMGEAPLRADHLEVSFDPGGDEQGRTASVHLIGGPVDPSLRSPIDLNINVRGSLDALMKFSTNSRLQFGGKK